MPEQGYTENPMNRLSNFNMQFLKLKKGVNNLIISGNDNIKFPTQIIIEYNEIVRLGEGILL